MRGLLVDNFANPHQSKLSTVRYTLITGGKCAEREKRIYPYPFLPVSTALITIKGFKF
jgi:hypothetical protein